MAHLATRVDGGADDWQLDARAKDSFSDSSNVMKGTIEKKGKRCPRNYKKTHGNYCEAKYVSQNASKMKFTTKKRCESGYKSTSVHAGKNGVAVRTCRPVSHGDEAARRHNNVKRQRTKK